MGLTTGLEGDGVIVTGAGGGIGRATSEAFAAAGARVCCLDIDADSVQQTVESLQGSGHLAMPFDLRDHARLPQLLQLVEGEFGGLRSLAHAAAVLRRRASLWDVTEEDWDLQHEVNLKATFFLNRAFAERLVARDSSGSITNLTSQGWWTGGFGGSVVYAATKGGIVSMSRGLARTLAPHAIRVNTVAPGGVDTAMMRGGLSEPELQAFVDQIPVGRLAEPAEIADVVVFLASDQARYITGATLNATGGQIMY